MVKKIDECRGSYFTPAALKRARQRLYDSGITLVQLSKQHDTPMQAFKDLLHNRTAGRSGHSHRAAVILGLKRERKFPTPKFISSATNAEPLLVAGGIRSIAANTAAAKPRKNSPHTASLAQE